MGMNTMDRLCCLLAGTVLAATTAAATPSLRQYRLTAKLEPATHRIEAEACIEGVPGPQFYLYKGMEIRKITSGDRALAFHWEPTAAAYRYAPDSAVVALDAPAPQAFCVQYAGTYPTAINNVNRLAPELAELAVYAAWCPFFQDRASFSFDLTVDLPSDFVVVTNGKLVQQDALSGRQVTRWKDVQPGSDLVLIAAPGLRREDGAFGDARVELYFKELSLDTVTALRDRLVDGLGRLTRVYGQPTTAGILRFVYSPRPGWGYSRPPLLVVSEGFAQDQLRGDFGLARTTHGSCHELAHFWWNIASAESPDDWINEGLAELSAFRLSRELFGDPFAERLLSEYREHAAKSSEDVAIAETESSSADRYVNRYEKTTLLFVEAGRLFGQERLDEVLRALYERHAGKGGATTALFLAEVERRLGATGRAFFENGLFAKRWSVDLLRPPAELPAQ